MAAEAQARARHIAQNLGGPILALETSAAQASVCLVTSEQVVERSLAAKTLPSDGLVDAIATLLHDHHCRVEDLRAMVVGLGPGSFTGLRVGLATAKGLALGCGVAVYGVSSLAVWAASGGPGLGLAVLDARRDELYAGLYDIAADGQVLQEALSDAIFTPQALHTALKKHAAAPLHVVGDMAGKFSAQLTATGGTAHGSDVTPRALFGVVQAQHAILAGTPVPLATLLPRYLRLSEAERQLATQRI